MNAPRTVPERAALAAALVPVATHLAYIVHEEPPAAVHAFLATVRPAHYPALVVVLAAMVDIEKTAEQLVGWADDRAAEIRTKARTWDAATLRRHHAAYARGDRDPWTVAGDSEYHRRHRKAGCQ